MFKWSDPLHTPDFISNFPGNFEMKSRSFLNTASALTLKMKILTLRGILFKNSQEILKWSNGCIGCHSI